MQPPRAEAIDHKVGAQPGHQPERQRLPFAEKANQCNRDLDHPHHQDQVPKLDADDGVHQGQEFGVAGCTPNFSRTSQ